MLTQEESEKTDVLLCTIEGTEIELVCDLPGLKVFGQFGD
jgi:hypothetical protein